MAAVSPLPTTKLLPPKVPAWAVARSRLDELLDHGTSSTLTLVSAPPGFGKTTLLADWAARRQLQGPVCWVGLDEHDNSRARIWRAVAAAVAERVPAHGEARESSGARASVDAANVLINRIAELDTPVVLILDDVHALGERSTLSDIAHLIKHAPPQLRLVLATRSDPSIPLGRYRLSGQLVEIRAAELAMTPDETRELLGPVADSLSQAEIETLCQRTDGWAAALRLAAISLESIENPQRFVAEFAADDRAISDYLLNEVLDQQPDELRTFLLQTSLPDRFTAELAADLTGRTDAGLVLADLDRRNLFLHRHGREDATYRYHSFFRTFLRAELMLERPDEIRGLHRIVASSSAGRGTRHGANRARDRRAGLAVDGRGGHRCLAAAHAARAPGHDPQADATPSRLPCAGDIRRSRCWTRSIWFSAASSRRAALAWTRPRAPRPTRRRRCSRSA